MEQGCNILMCSRDVYKLHQSVSDVHLFTRHDASLSTHYMCEEWVISASPPWIPVCFMGTGTG